MAVVTLNIWTGAPLLALWIGSRVQGDGPPTMGAIFVVVVCLLAGVLGLAYLLVKVLAVLDDVYARASGRPSSVQRHVPWLRSMRGEREHYEGDPPVVLTALERTLVVVVVLAVATFEVWFFFFSGSPIGGGSSSGRD